MVKLYAALFALTLATSSALASPYGRIGISQRELDQEFSRREYLLDARDTSDDLEARGFLDLFSFAGKAFKAGKALKSGGQFIEKAKKVEKEVKRVHEVTKQFQPQQTNKQPVQVTVQQAQAPYLKLPKVHRHGDRGRFINSMFGYLPGGNHRRGLEDDEELLQRDFDAEDLFGREYDDFLLVERDAFYDLD